MKKNTSTIVVVVSYLIVLIFTIVCMGFSYLNICIPDILIEWVYKFFGLELIALSGIKISKHVGSAFGRVEESIQEIEEVIDGIDEEV